ncbi:MAG TPA: succinate dehydrogenase, cytochrome b556 subunit [Anaerolineales bacterium]|nr:succinate dehydrogenase, cytochrome b556 subunit [Anaerolineales bacterium]
MTSFRVPLEGSLRYRGREGQWAYLLHRITGLGTLLFLTVHILDTSTVYFVPSLYEHAIALYRSTPFMLGEIVLVFCVLYHGTNGLRIALFDLFPRFWNESRQRNAFRWVLGAAIVLWLPAAFLMGRALIVHNFLGG